MKWLCKFAWHRWTPWSEPKTARVHDGYTAREQSAQERFCRRCNKKEMRKVMVRSGY